MAEERRNRKFASKDEEFGQELIEVARVTRVSKGGKKMKFRATLAIGDKKGRVGVAIAKGADVSQAISKAFIKAKKNLIKVPLTKNNTIYHEIFSKYGAAKIILKPAPPGTGVKAGGAVRTILELAGVQNVTGKILGSSNKINNVKAAIQALSSFKKPKKAEKPEENKVDESAAKENNPEKNNIK